MKFEEMLKKIWAKRPPEEVPPQEKPHIPHYEADPNFLQQKRERYRLQYEFFKRAPEPTGECLDPETCGQPGGQFFDAEGKAHHTFSSEHLCENCRAWAKWEVRRECYRRLAENPDDDTNVSPNDAANIREFSVRVNAKSTMEQIGEEIDRQVKEIKRRLREEKAKGLIVRDWLRTEQGKRRATGKKDPLVYWRRCLKVYDLKTECGYGWEAIGVLIEQARTKRRCKKPKGTLTRAVRDDFEEAERLIRSAAHGTFPD